MPNASEKPGPRLNTTTQVAPTEGALATAVGWLELSADGCLYLETKDGPLDLVWPADFRLGYHGKEVVIADDVGPLALKIGHRATLVGADLPEDERMSCEVAANSTPFLFSDFLGKTLAGGNSGFVGP